MRPGVAVLRYGGRSRASLVRGARRLVPLSHRRRADAAPRPRRRSPGAPRAGAAATACRIVARYPHDRAAFTEGLLWHDGALYESTGRKGSPTSAACDSPTAR